MVGRYTRRSRRAIRIESHDRGPVRGEGVAGEGVVEAPNNLHRPVALMGHVAGGPGAEVRGGTSGRELLVAGCEEVADEKFPGVDVLARSP